MCDAEFQAAGNATVDEAADAGEQLPEHDEGPVKQQPIRSCIATRQRLPTEDLIRFVAAPDGSVVPDLRARLPGRGVWVTARASSVEAAVKRKAFARGLKAQVTVDPALADTVGRLIARDGLQSLAIANKAGAVVAGHAKVEAAIENGKAKAILHATDAAADGVRKIGQALKRHFGDMVPIPVLSAYSSAEMSLCLGREHVIHLCLVDSPASKPALQKCQLFLRYGEAA